MSLLAFIGWILVGVVATACLVTFWDEIRQWLNNSAADTVERILGYGARERMHKAVSRIDRVVDKVRNKTIVYTKKNDLDSYYDKTTLLAESPSYEIKHDILEEIRKSNGLVQEFQYKI